MTASQELYRDLDPPYGRFDNSMLGPEFPAELDLVSRLWFRCGYRSGIGAYLNFFLLRDFIATHDGNFPPRFASMRSMAESFYRTDLFIRDITDSGVQATGGISSAKVRGMLQDIQKRHVNVKIPPWMQTYFGFSLLENVEKQCAPLTDEEKRLHLAYMAKAYRVMGLRFSEDRAQLERFARAIEAEQAANTENVAKHSRHILRIGELNPVLNAFNLVSDRALDDAKASEARWRAGQPKGLLDGVPVSIKDIILTKGWPTLRGSKTVDAKGPWNDDAPATARLREHGAVLLGKTTTPEFGWKGVTDSPLTGITRNPWNPAKTPGGASGGAAAAVAAGMGALAVGTDGGGSIRIPCSFTGLFGIKASFGRVPAWPMSPFGSVAHVGPMTRSVTDAALMLNVLSLPDARDWYALPHEPRDYRAGLDTGVRDLRIAYSPNLGYAKVDPEIASIVKVAVSVFEELGARVEEKHPGFDNAAPIFQAHWFSGAAALMRTVKDKKPCDPGLLEVAAQGEQVTAAEHIDAQMKRG